MNARLPFTVLRLRRGGLVAALSIALLTAGWASAQDPGASSKKAPNVLLIVDTSGSMEYKAGLDEGDPNNFPCCDPSGGGTGYRTPSLSCVSGGTSERSRWIDLVEVLSGTIPSYRCESVSRSTSAFASLYDLPGTGNHPPDYDYRNPYHRPLSGTCAPRPDTSTLSTITNAYQFVAPTFGIYNSPATSCTFPGAADGLIDSFSTNIRFGLMTFDTLVSDLDGVGPASTYAPEWANGIEGAWSYYFNAPAAGRPASCTTPKETMEVGARNGAAPAWEGKMIAFGDPDASTSSDAIRHTRIEQVLLSTRPYGATPIAGALTDAQTFFNSDTSVDPTPASDVLHSTYYGPAMDPYVQGGCRDQYVVLLTDGEPNLDLRPHCEGADINQECPFHRSDDIASELNSGSRPIRTFVVGFAKETAGALDCNDLTLDWEPGGICDAATGDLKVCCTLHQIAIEGGTERAYFGSDKTALRTQLSTVFNEILAGGGSATQPVTTRGVGTAEGGTGGSNPTPVAFRLLTSYENSSTGVWRGTIERMRWVCESPESPPSAPTPQLQSKDASKGDDFSFNVNSHPTARTFLTYVPTAVSGVVYSDRSIRPNIADGTVDGVGQNAGSTTMLSGAPATFTSNLPAAALKPDLTSGACNGLTANACRDRIVTWFTGGDNGTGNHRCATLASSPTDINCSVIGDVMHSTPVVVNHPTAEIDDETYSKFRGIETGVSTRPMVAYTSSNDGVLHAFKISPNVAADPDVMDSSSNELYAFVPPAVLPQLASQYPKSRQKLLDGIPIVADVAATCSADPCNEDSSYYPFQLQRTAGNVQTNEGTLTFRTILVQAFGGSQSGYFALDVTKVGTHTGNKQPKLLWQLTTDSNGNPLFGRQGGTPLITTLNVGGVETAVAVLPGGQAQTAPGSCNRAVSSHPQISSDYPPRTQVRCYEFDKDNDGLVEAGDDATYIGARSLTIVRLDTGQIIQRFSRAITDAAAPLSTKIKAASLDSPIVGTPAAYPVGPGAVSDRIFVGDQDGAIWRVDTSAPTPASWTMELFFDAYAKHPDYSTPAMAAAAGRPIVVAPTLSVDDRGRITLAAATGDQDLSGGPGEEHYVWSLLEGWDSTVGHYETNVNWYQQLNDGEHVLGPLQLNEGVLFFSTFKPNTGDACVVGSSSVFGVDYIKAKTTNPSEGGRGALHVQGSTTVVDVQSATATQLGLDVSTLIFGITLEYAPTCYNDSGIGSALLGGSHPDVGSPSASTLQLTFQTGKTNTTGVGNSGFKTGVSSVTLAQRPSGATIESWAAILE